MKDDTAEFFKGYERLKPGCEAYDGETIVIGNPRSGDMAAAWWTGKGAADKNGLWAQVHYKGEPSKLELDRDRVVQEDFNPTHFRPRHLPA